ncbi:hypothetical protein RD792_017056 [Penstemon davidsonii]|uniref:BTB domain-containing protein n=1 Tax=Penstemon davidsonii TaxID=160366 RepID=A0ABR0CLW6_9LAMI|nr:hypothetical protein RD792_017056 [Penstemon davidsonii]
MYDSTRHNHRRRRRHWCCSFSNPPLSPKKTEKIEIPFSNSPQKLPFARRILSPGRVSPISDVPMNKNHTPKAHKPPISDGNFDVRLNLKGKIGGSLILELGSDVLTANSAVFADLVSDYRMNNNLSGNLCRIEVPDVENLSVFREAIEFMFEDEEVIQNKLLKIGVFRTIHILEVSAGIKFNKGVSSCLKYLEAVPWTEEEEEKLRELLTKLNFDNATTTNILDRLFTLNNPVIDFQRRLTKQLISSVTASNDANARNEMKPLVKGLISRSSVYEKEYPDLSKEDILSVCESCLCSLTRLIEEAATPSDNEKYGKPLLERISKQVDNINWVLDILLDHQMAEEFVDMWANEVQLVKMHEIVSPMVRYELSRVSAMLFIAMGTRKLHCKSETRLGFLQVWFRPMLSDFGWLQRCRKGLDIKALEEAMGQSLLTLPLKEQYALFMDWFGCFSKNGTECPNLSKAFQIWWRRSFLRGSETFAIESR